MEGRNISWKVFLALLLVVLAAGSGRAETDAGGIGLKPRYREGELIVKYKEGVSEDGKMKSRERHGSAKKRGFRELGMEHVRLKQGKGVEEAVKEYESDADVEYAEPDYIVEAMNTPYDPQFYSLWGLARINAPAAWDTSTGSAAVVVAVIDTGVDYTHGDLKSNMWVNQAELNGKPGVDDDGNGVVDDIYGCNAAANNGNPMDDNSHGTHVAGTIGAVGNNGIGVAGVNWNVRVLACKFLSAAGSGYISDAIECLQYIKGMKARGVNIVATNNSWGGAGYSQALYDAINSQRDILFIASAGNSASNIDTTPTYPADYYLPNVIAVAASTSADGLASFSNYGRRTIHVAAPGEGILSTIPGNGYGYKSGTSMAAPHVTGLAALIKAKDGNLDWRGIRNLLLSSGDPLAALDGKSVTGRRINGFNALTCLDSREFSALQFPASIQVGLQTTLSALSINCATPAGPVTVALSDGKVIELHDDGIAPDQAAGDGVFSTTFTPTRATETFYFSSPVGSETIGNQLPLRVVTALLPDATVGAGYSQTIAASGGIGPYTWSVTSGNLPPGLSLDTVTGSISGMPTVAGSFSFTLQVQAGTGTRASKPFSLNVNGAGWRVNVAAQANGGVTSASSVYPSGNYPVRAANDGDRKGLNWGAGGGWNDATENLYPDWVQVTFSGQKTIGEIDVFTVQDNYTSPLEPTAAMTFTKNGITSFDVQYWNGVSWVTVPGGSVTGNNLVWRKLTFPAVTTDRVRVLVNASLARYSRITEIEAYGY